jgi:hypothetical protein
MTVGFDGPTLLVSSVVAAVVSTGLVRATCLVARRFDRSDQLPRMLLGLALILLGILLIAVALRRMLVLPL